MKIPKEVYLNINCPNVPITKIKGVLFVPTGRCRYRNRVQPIEEKTRQVYRLYGTKIEEEEPSTDSWAVDNNYIDITPLHRDQTDRATLSRLKKQEFSL